MLTESEKEQLKERLRQLVEEVSQSIEQMKLSSQPVSLDDPIGRVSRIDAIQQQQMALASLGREKARLERLYSALKRIEEKDFGLCSICEEAIPWKRLLAHPESTMCVDCAE